MAINEASASQRGTKSDAHEKAPMRKAPLEARRRGEEAPKAAQVKAAKPKREAAARTVPRMRRMRFSTGWLDFSGIDVLVSLKLRPRFGPACLLEYRLGGRRE
jgi:hypothetical protein